MSVAKKTRTARVCRMRRTPRKVAERVEPRSGPADYRPVAYDYDLVVIGSGPAGQKAAIQAAKLGRRVALVDRGHEPLHCLTLCMSGAACIVRRGASNGSESRPRLAGHGPGHGHGPPQARRRRSHPRPDDRADGASRAGLHAPGAHATALDHARSAATRHPVSRAPATPLPGPGRYHEIPDRRMSQPGQHCVPGRSSAARGGDRLR